VLEAIMTAFNAVRFRVKPGREQDFLDAHKRVHADWPGLKRVDAVEKVLDPIVMTLDAAWAELGMSLGY
jgi:hypothetical protein